MPIVIKPTSEIKARLGIEPNGRVQKFFTNACYKHMDKYVPRSAGSRGGKLRETVDIQSDSITYEMPYARYQYFGIRQDGTRVVMNYTTPGTGPYWDELMWTAEGDSIVKQVQKEIDRGGK